MRKNENKVSSGSKAAEVVMNMQKSGIRGDKGGIAERDTVVLGLIHEEECFGEPM